MYVDESAKRKAKIEKRKIADSKVIDSTNYLVSYADDPKPIILGICQTHQLTDDFIREFYGNMTPYMFSTSYKLTTDMAAKYPALFDIDELERYLKKLPSKAEEEEIERKKAEEAANNPDASEEDQTAAPVPTEEPTYDVERLKTLHLSLAAAHPEYFGDITETESDEDEEEYNINDAKIDALAAILREATDAEVNEYSPAFIGKNTKVDTLILTRVKDEDVRNSIILSVVTREGSRLSSAVYKYLSNDMKENILGDEDVSAEDFVNALAETKDLGWQLAMLQKVEDGTMTLREVNCSNEKELLHLVDNLPEDAISKVFKLLQPYLQVGFTARLCQYVLENKEFTEDQLIYMYPAFKGAGAYFALKAFAKKNGYNNLLAIM